MNLKISYPPSAGASEGKAMTGDAPMSRRDRLRRVLILCRNFAANLAYYRVGRRPEYLPLQKTSESFWLVVSGNAIDISVLEWCKLFADPKAKHHWNKIVSDPAKFKAELLRHLGIDEAAFDKEVELMRRYRDKFLAHLDSDETMNIPGLDIAKLSVWFYFDYVVRNEAQPEELGVGPEALMPGMHNAKKKPWRCTGGKR
jgi:hypothetical protein